MRVLVAAAVLAVVVGVAVPGAEAQLSFGPGGFGLPPINIVSVFKFLRDFFLALWTPATTSAAKITDTKTSAAKTSSPPATNGTKSEPYSEREEKSEAEEATSLLDQEDLDEVTVHTILDQEPRIVEKFDAGCEEDDSGDCLEAASVAAKDGLVVPANAVAASAALLGRWPVGYIVFIIICFWITVVISTPYFITGETIARRDEEHTYMGLVDQQDILLLLAWLLGEVSHDNSCLERIVCLTPDKSSKYITVSSMIFKIAGYLRRWVPYSPRYVDQLHHMNEVTEDGYSQSCHKYSCPTVPEL